MVIGVVSKGFNLQADIDKAVEKYSLLNRVYSVSDGIIHLVGEIEVVDHADVFIDIFEVEIYYPKEFPKRFPMVFETGGKIPREPEKRHVMPRNYNLCLAVELEEILVCKHGITTLWFLNNIVVPRLAEEYRVSRGEKYQREYSHHDLDGTWEFLMKELGTKDARIVLTLIEAMALRQLPRADKLCLCSSGKLYKYCHRPKVVQLQNLGGELLNKIYRALSEQPYKGIN